MIGQIVRMSEGTNYGFIQADKEEDYFFHESGCEDFQTIKEDFLKNGEHIRVEFTPVEGRDGKLRAENVRRIRL